MNLYTANNFAVVRQLADPSDVGTYYVQAVIRNAYTDDILATINLTDKGNQRFRKEWKVPADPSGEGFYVSIITSVYSDSTYATKSTVYGSEENTYLVSDKPRTSRGGGQGLSRSDVREILQQELAKAKEESDAADEANKASDVDEPEKDYTDSLNAIASMISSLKEAVSLIPKDKDDTAPILQAITALHKAMIEIEKPEKVDFAPIMSMLKDAKENDELTADEMKSIIADLEKSILAKVTDVVTGELANTTFVTSFITHAQNGGVQTKKPIPVEEGPKEIAPFDIKKLAK